MRRGPFTVDELTGRGIPVPEACMIVWPTPEEQFAEFVRSRPREIPADRVASIEARRDLARGLYVPHGGEVHHFRDESRH